MSWAEMVWAVLIMTAAMGCWLYVWVTTLSDTTDHPNIRAHFPSRPRRGPHDPCPVTGLHACPWHPDGGEHPGAAP